MPEAQLAACQSGIVIGWRKLVSANFCAVMGFANRKPWTMSKSISRTAKKSARVSTPSGDRATAEAVGDLEDLPACGPFQAIVGAAGNELTVDLDFDKREVVQADKRETFRPEIVDRNGDVAESNLSCDRSRQVQIGNEIRGADFDDQPVKRG